MVFHNGSNCHYHFIINKLEKEFEVEHNCLVENTKKHKPFSVSITKAIKIINKNEKETTKTIYYRFQILLIILLKEFIKLNIIMDMII